MTDTRTPWHAGAELLERYAAGTLDHVAQAAVETHVTGCADCRRAAASLVEQRTPVDLNKVWERVQVDIVRRPTPGAFRFLQRLGVRETDLVILRASSNLLVALAVAIIATVGFAVAAASLSSGEKELFYLAIAPLLPTLLVAGAYDTTDPLRDVADATPFSALRIALLRTVVAVLGALPLVAAMAVVPTIDASIVTWLLPSLALTLMLLTLLTWVDAPVALLAVSLSWFGALAALRMGGDPSVITGPPGQAVCAAVVLCSTVVLLNRHGLLLAVRER
jgi:hypothetical protein